MGQPPVLLRFIHKVYRGLGACPQENLDPHFFNENFNIYEWNWLPHLLVLVRHSSLAKFQGGGGGARFCQGGGREGGRMPLLNEALHVFMRMSVLYKASQWQGVDG